MSDLFSVAAVGAPVVREEADFGLSGSDDSLQAGLLGGVAHVLQHPLQQLEERQEEHLEFRLKPPQSISSKVSG